MTCFIVRNLFSSYLDNKVSNGKRKEIEKHLSACPECSLLYDTLKKNIEICKNLPPLDIPESVIKEWESAIVTVRRKAIFFSIPVFLAILMIAIFLIMNPPTGLIRRDDRDVMEVEMVEKNELSVPEPKDRIEVKHMGNHAPSNRIPESAKEGEKKKREMKNRQMHRKKAKEMGREWNPPRYNLPLSGNAFPHWGDGNVIYVSTIEEDLLTFLRERSYDFGWVVEYIDPYPPVSSFSTFNDYQILELEIPADESSTLVNILEEMGSVIFQSIDKKGEKDGRLKVKVSIQFIL